MRISHNKPHERKTYIGAQDPGYCLNLYFWREINLYFDKGMRGRAGDEWKSANKKLRGAVAGDEHELAGWLFDTR